MPQKKNILPAPPKGWRDPLEKSIPHEFPVELHSQALRILRRPEAETALAYMIDAGGEERATARFMKALRRCAYYATPPQFSYSFRDPKIASRIIESVEIILKEMDFMIDPECEDGDERPCHNSLLEVIDFVKNVSTRRAGAPSPRQKYMCLLHLEAFFRRWFKRPVHEAITAWAKATFPGDYRGKSNRNRPAVNTIQIEMRRARKLLMTPKTRE